MDFGDVVGAAAGGDMQSQLLEMKQKEVGVVIGYRTVGYDY